VKKHATSASVIQERVRGKGKGKEALYRLEGEVVGPAEADGDGMREEEVIVRDPRREKGFKKLTTMRPMRTELIEAKYEVSPFDYASRKSADTLHLLKW
jgi:histone-lysine N-methyltransferase SETD1